MENFLYTYFSQKYGLKDIVQMEVASVIEYINKFEDQSSIVRIFKRILKNDIDEKFYWFV